MLHENRVRIIFILFKINMKEINMMQLVHSAEQVEANAVRFKNELDANPALQERLSYARAWYAFRDGSGGWRYVPSKFGGYRNMTAAEYLNDAPRDGRRTEKQLGQWFVEVPDGSELHAELYGGLVGLLNAYGKTPSTKARISVSAAPSASHDEPSPGDSALVDLILLVARRLPANERARLRSEI